MKQYVKDNAGHLIEVTDLQAAISQIAVHLTYIHDKAKLTQSTADLVEQKYWKDLYTKLCLLREKAN